MEEEDEKNSFRHTKRKKKSCEWESDVQQQQQQHKRTNALTSLAITTLSQQISMSGVWATSPLVNCI
jgi:hypothetical protein